MVAKPITIARKEYIHAICNATNNSGLPAFVVVNVLEKVLSEMQKQEEIEYKRDMATYRKSLTETKEVTESAENQSIPDIGCDGQQ